LDCSILKMKGLYLVKRRETFTKRYDVTNPEDFLNLQQHHCKGVYLFKYCYFPDEETQMRDEILEEFERFDSSRTFSDRLFSIMGQLPLAALFNLSPVYTGLVLFDRAVCMTCRSVVDALLIYTRVHSEDDLRNLLYSLCTYLGIQNEEVCAGVIDLNMVTDSHCNVLNSLSNM
jgi:hypothetical protein